MVLLAKKGPDHCKVLKLLLCLKSLVYCAVYMMMHTTNRANSKLSKALSTYFKIEKKFYSPIVIILPCISFLSFFSNVTVNTPSVYLAFTLSGSTSFGSLIDLSNVPKLLSILWNVVPGAPSSRISFFCPRSVMTSPFTETVTSSRLIPGSSATTVTVLSVSETSTRGMRFPPPRVTGIPRVVSGRKGEKKSSLKTESMMFDVRGMMSLGENSAMG
eukprot:CAMPEP_0184719204 /NCGR_PEP_ID=MMETSP0314-20130426/8187_1 /TAXON_ID=38298 /ORGANISM="Rhodella maculata, Strain CCMP 736" /LENGTH=215 /DNA_ID=CAMNT_0027183059 /DNA_START=49 /DNA_END=696 /DNA_ORIENTATION=+